MKSKIEASISLTNHTRHLPCKTSDPIKYVKKFTSQQQHTQTCPHTPIYASTSSTPKAQPLYTATMDSLGGSLANIDATKLSDRDKQELQRFAQNEGQKARIQSCMSYSPTRHATGD